MNKNKNYNKNQNSQFKIKSIKLENDAFLNELSQEEDLEEETSPLVRKNSKQLQNASSKPTVSNNASSLPNSPLISTSSLPKKYASLFSFSSFNKLQSSLFQTLINTNKNLIISAPTNSGKTTLFELAIIKKLNVNNSKQKNDVIIYLSPTKSLCQEQIKSWQKFSKFIRVQEFTSDTKNCDFIRQEEGNLLLICTPEKLLTIKDLDFFLRRVKLILVDEVHVLQERTSFEVLITRCLCLNKEEKRFVCLSATIPNSLDFKEWIRESEIFDGFNVSVEDSKEKSKIVLGYSFPLKQKKNYFLFENKQLTSALPSLIQTHNSYSPPTNSTSNASSLVIKEQMIIFCCTRKSTEQTAQFLFENNCLDSYLHINKKLTTKSISCDNKQLLNLLQYRIAFHHAGLTLSDKKLILDLFLKKELILLCCTSTLAIGVNLPCNVVVIKGTMVYRKEQAKYVEIGEKDLMQMVGRAGRGDGNDVNAKIIVMTELENVKQYEGLLNGNNSDTGGGGSYCIESGLIKSEKELTETLFNEISLGVIFNRESGLLWLKSTFFAVRVKKNPQYYLENYQQILNFDSATNSDLVLDLYNKIEGKLIKCKLINESYQVSEVGDLLYKFGVDMNSLDDFSGKESYGRLIELCLSNVPHDLVKSVEGFAANLKQLENKLPYETTTKIGLLFVAGLCHLLPGNPRNYKSVAYQFKNLVPHAKKFIKFVVSFYVLNQFNPIFPLRLMKMINAERIEDDQFTHLVFTQLKNIGEKNSRSFVQKLKVSTISDLYTTDCSSIEVAVKRNPPFGNDLKDWIEKNMGFNVLMKKVEITRDGNDDAEDGVKVALEISCKQEVKSFWSLVLLNSENGFVDYKRIGLKKERVVKIDLPNEARFAHLINEKYVGCDKFMDLEKDGEAGSDACSGNGSTGKKQQLSIEKYLKRKNDEIVFSVDETVQAKKKLKQVVTKNDIIVNEEVINEVHKENRVPGLKENIAQHALKFPSIIQKKENLNNERVETKVMKRPQLLTTKLNPVTTPKKYEMFEEVSPAQQIHSIKSSWRDKFSFKGSAGKSLDFVKNIEDLDALKPVVINAVGFSNEIRKPMTRFTPAATPFHKSIPTMQTVNDGVKEEVKEVVKLPERNNNFLLDMKCDETEDFFQDYLNSYLF